MPTILNIDAYRFFIYSNENDEPPHIHVRRDRAVAKFWVDPIALAHNAGFPGHELRKIERIIADYRDVLLKGWYEHLNR